MFSPEDTEKNKKGKKKGGNTQLKMLFVSVLVCVIFIGRGRAGGSKEAQNSGMENISSGLAPRTEGIHILCGEGKRCEMKEWVTRVVP